MKQTLWLELESRIYKRYVSHLHHLWWASVLDHIVKELSAAHPESTSAVTWLMTEAAKAREGRAVE